MTAAGARRRLLTLSIILAFKQTLQWGASLAIVSCSRDAGGSSSCLCKRSLPSAAPACSSPLIRLRTVAIAAFWCRDAWRAALQTVTFGSRSHVEPLWTVGTTYLDAPPAGQTPPWGAYVSVRGQAALCSG